MRYSLLDKEFDMLRKLCQNKGGVDYMRAEYHVDTGMIVGVTFGRGQDSHTITALELYGGSRSLFTACEEFIKKSEKSKNIH